MTYINDPLPPMWKMWLVGLLAGLAFFTGAAEVLERSRTGWLSGGPTRLDGVVFDINGRRIELTAGQALLVRPLDHIRLARVLAGGAALDQIFLEGDGFDAQPIKTGVKVLDLWPDLTEARIHDLILRQGSHRLGRVILTPVVLPVDLVLLAQTATEPDRFKLIQQALEFSPDNPMLLDQLYRTALALDRPDQAARALNKRLAFSLSATDLTALAGLYAKMDRKKDEAAVLQELARLEPEKSGWNERLLTLAEDTGDEELRLAALKRLAENEAGPKSSEAAKKLGYALAKAGKLKEAVAAYRQAAELDPNDVNIYHNLVVLHEKMSDKAGWRKAMEELARHQPNNMEAVKKLARTAPKDELVAAWERVLRLNPQDQEALVQLIKLLQPQGPSANLAQYYDRLARIRPTDPVVHYNHGLTLSALKRYPEATKALETAHRLAPKDRDVLLGLLETLRARNMIKGGSTVLEKLIALEPGKLEYYELLADWLTRLKEHDRLGRILAAGVKTLPNAPELWQLLADNRLAAGDAAGAIQALERLVAFRPKDIDGLMKLAGLYEKSGQPAKAMNMYQAVMNLDPDHPRASKEYMRLRLEALKSG